MVQEDVARLVGRSDDIRTARRRRIKEIEWENRLAAPVPVVEAVPPRLAIEPPPLHPDPRRPWYREEDRYVEREISYRGGRPPGRR